MPTQSNIDNWEKRFTDDFGYMHESCRDFIRSLLHTTRQQDLDDVLDTSYEMANNETEWTADKHEWVAKVISSLKSNI